MQFTVFVFTFVNSVKFLGVILDNGLTWRDHIMSISKKVSKCVGILSKLKSILPSSVLKALYNALIVPYL